MRARFTGFKQMDYQDAITQELANDPKLKRARQIAMGIIDQILKAEQTWSRTHVCPQCHMVLNRNLECPNCSSLVLKKDR